MRMPDDVVGQTRDHGLSVALSPTHDDGLHDGEMAALCSILDRGSGDGGACGDQRRASDEIATVHAISSGEM